MSFTEQQTRAIYTHDRNLIVVAGAGSGKTRVLVERYLALLDANPDWPLGALVAITFTRKAAQEMRDRVRQALETRRNATSTPAERDRWTELAGQIETARIDTIHGLCADILRANAAEAHLDPDFALLDEVESGILFSDIVEATLRRVVDNDLPEVRLLSNYGVDRVRDALLGAVSLRHDRYVKTYQPEAYLAAWAELWQQEVYRALRWFLTEANEIAFPDPLPESDTFAEKIVHARQCVAAVRSTMMHDHNPEEALAVLEELQGISKRGGSIKKWGDEAALSWAKDEFDRLRKLAKDVHGLIGGPLAEHDEIAAQLLPLWGELLRRVHAAFRDYKHSESLLDFDDLEVMTRDLLVHNPEVAARYRGREFRHLLVDEFQDTNAVQWQIVQALSDLESPGSVFVVGDPKQSIYAFRGADVSVFGQVREQITATSAGEHLPLSRSFRTHKPLIDGLNALFSRLLVRDLDSPVASYQVTLGEPLEAHRSTSPTDDPPVELLLIGRESVDGNGDAANLRADDRREWEASEITNRISVLVRSGRLVYDREMADTRPVQFGDVAILFQSLSNVTIYETAFKTAGIPFVTVSGRGYYDRQEVWDLLNLLRALHNPADDLSLASVLRSPMFSVSDDGLLALKLSAQQYDLTLWEALSLEPMPVTGSDGAHADFARRTLDVLRGLSGRVTIAELLHEALAQTGYLAVLTGLPDGARRRGNVEKLIEKAEISERVTLGEFSRYLEDLSAREVREGEAAVDAGNAVTLMTVHASKGLEFPVVVLADAAWERGGGSSGLLVADEARGLACRIYDPAQDKMVATFFYRYLKQLEMLRDEAERLRLLYVAATRAQDLLIISGQVTCKAGEALSSKGWLSRLLEGFELTSEMEPGDDLVHDYSWGSIRVMIPAGRPKRNDDEYTPRDGVRQAPVDAEPVQPYLLTPITWQPAEQIRHIAATHIADLGSATSAYLPAEQRFYRERFRRRVLYDAPNVVESLNGEEGPSPIYAYQIGEIVHEALRHWHLPGRMPDDQLDELLTAYAWRLGITAPVALQEATNRSRRLLSNFAQSPLYHQISEAEAVYRELPFIYERDGFVIHGVIDLLCRLSDGRWVLLDYKTSNFPNTLSAEIHARRYHLQIGVYADAVTRQLNGIVPETYIHYIRRMKSVQVSAQDWGSALERSIASHIQSIIEERSE